jgi:hypothetical protein
VEEPNRCACIAVMTKLQKAHIDRPSASLAFVGVDLCDKMS